MKESITYTEGDITKIINAKYAGNCKYKCANIYVFAWESDFFVQKFNGYTYEFEVKISRSDFFNDFKKTDKHEAMKGNLKRRLPNKFYYVVPSGLINTDEVPDYAGLIYVDGFHMVTVKEAPFFHKEKHKLDDELCMKFYSRWNDLRQENIKLRQRIKEMQRNAEPTLF